MMRDGDLEPHDWRACDRERQMPAGADDEEVHLRFVRLAKTCISRLARPCCRQPSCTGDRRAETALDRECFLPNLFGGLGAIAPSTQTM
jgi:hypothetical protein